MILGIIVNLLLSLWVIPEYLGSKRKIGFNWSLVACLFLTPLIGVIITLLSPKLEEYRKESIVAKKEDFKMDSSIDTLTDLKQKGIITDEEYRQKVNKIKAEKAEQEIKKSNEYQQLKNLLDRGILTNEEFENKSKLIRVPTEEAYRVKKQIIKKTNSSNYISIYKVRLVIGILLIVSQLLNIIAVVFKLFINKNYNHLTKDITTICIFLIIGLLIHPKTIEKLKKVL